MSINITVTAGDLKTIQKLSQFKTKEEFNALKKGFLSVHRYDLTSGAVEFLDKLSKYSVKEGFFGVCWKLVTNWAKEEGKAVRTIQRYFKEYEEHGLIHRVKTIKKKGGYGHPVIVFIRNNDWLNLGVTSNVTSEMSPRQSEEKPCGTKEEAAKNEAQTLNLLNSFQNSLSSKDSKTENGPGENIHLDASFVSKDVPEDFVNRVKPFLNDCFEIEHYWNAAKVIFNDYKETTTDLTELAIEAFNRALKNKALGKIKTTFKKCFNGIVRTLLNDEVQADEELMEKVAAELRKERAAEKPKVERKDSTPKRPVYNWLEVDPNEQKQETNPNDTLINMYNQQALEEAKKACVSDNGLFWVTPKQETVPAAEKKLYW